MNMGLQLEALLSCLERKKKEKKKNNVLLFWLWGKNENHSCASNLLLIYGSISQNKRTSSIPEQTQTASVWSPYVGEMTDRCVGRGEQLPNTRLHFVDFHLVLQLKQMFAYTFIKCNKWD